MHRAKIGVWHAGVSLCIAVVACSLANPYAAAQLSVFGRSDISGCAEQFGQDKFAPEWSSFDSQVKVVLEYDNNSSTQQNGAALAQAVQDLQPGQTLIIGQGTYDLTAPLRLLHQGTAESPIVIRGTACHKPTITRSNSGTIDVFEIGGELTQNRAEYIALRHLEITGGANGIRVHKAHNIWMDHLNIHDTGDGGIKARTERADFLYITNNRIHDLGMNDAPDPQFGEGIVLGLSSVRNTTDSVVARNQIFNSQSSTSGMGIQIRFGSHSNWIVENRVHDTKFPCIYFDSANGGGPNVVERNVVYDCGDNGIQAEGGGAVVVNNLLVGPFGNKGFDSSHNAATLSDLYIAHNTILDEGGFGAALFAWDGQPELYFVNNIVYVRKTSGGSYTIALGSGAGGVIEGNVVYQDNSMTPAGVQNLSTGFSVGQGLSDFRGALNWPDTFKQKSDYEPAPAGALWGSALPDYLEALDLQAQQRTRPHEAGCLDGK